MTPKGPFGLGFGIMVAAIAVVYLGSASHATEVVFQLLMVPSYGGEMTVTRAGTEPGCPVGFSMAEIQTMVSTTARTARRTSRAIRLAHLLPSGRDVRLDLLRCYGGGNPSLDSIDQRVEPLPPVVPVLEALGQKSIHSTANENGQALPLLNRQMLEGTELVVVKVDVGAPHLHASFRFA